MDFRTATPEAVGWLATRLEEAGFETWVVGGAIRDLLLGRAAGDWDFATTARPEEIRATFRRTVPIGLEHGTVGVLARGGALYHVTTLRRDLRTDGRRAVVEFGDDIEEDLARRDFTFNAIAWHPTRGDVLDPAGGLADIEAGILRTVGDPHQRFGEDYLRVLRALRFSGQFGFTIAEETWGALCDAVPWLGTLSAERIQEELMKVLAQSDRPSRALGLYDRSGALAKLYPELAQDRDGLGRSRWEEALRVCDAVRRWRPLVRLAALLSPLAHEDPGEACAVRARVVGLTKRLRFSNQASRQLSTLVANRTLPRPKEDAVQIRRWLHRTGPEFFPDTARVWCAEARARVAPVGASEPASPAEVAGRIRAIRSALSEKPPLAVGDLALDGERLQALGLPPGPRFGEILDGALEQVLEDPDLNTRARLEEWVRQSDFLGDVPDGEPDPRE